ncbi:MAG: 2-succinyl-6-hydroxy-2,4-cyclohexadiene-1-carboxylate synthase [Geobacteraceae bacterium]|nr:2-succinyl-6-hydroxy-2,4-cyclohexadiene-1-carboxylate synthase [Geobacteraceae bacterium]
MAITTTPDSVTPLNTESARDASLPRILFLHGFLGSGSDWVPIARQLEKEYCCILVDLPGHGESDIEANGNPDLFFTETVDALAMELSRSAAPEPCFLVGYSMGGRIALSLLLRHPELFEKAIIVSASPGLRTEGERLSRRESDEGIARKIERNFEGFIKAWYEQPLFATLKNHPIFKEVESERIINNPGNLASALRLLGTGRQPSVWDELQKNRVPIQFFVGEKDLKFVEINRQMVNLCPESSLEIFKECGHTLHFENRELFLDRLTTFFNKHQQS